MYFDDHMPPHFHALHDGEEAVFDLSGRLLTGRLSVRAMHLIRLWARQHRKELNANWRKALCGAELDWIEPLR